LDGPEGSAGGTAESSSPTRNDKAGLETARDGGLEMAFEGSREKFGIFAELWAFMRVRKKWWLGPIVLMLALLGLLVVFTQGSAVAPFIYTLF
jgi:hypothetical protein